MIKKVTVTNYLGKSREFVLDQSAEFSGVAISRIEGLGPPKASISTTEAATMDGASYNSARTQQRNIVMSFILLFDPTVEDSRLATYKYFPIKQRVNLLIETDRRLVETYGYVESNEPDIFSEMVTSHVSIICPDSYLYSQGYTTSLFYGIDPLFKFPFSNESLDEPLIEFGKIEPFADKNLYYEGDVEIGLTINIHFLGPADDITIYNRLTREQMRIDTSKLTSFTGRAVDAGDDIIISTVRGNKRIQLLRDGVYYNILNCIDRDSDWFVLKKGDNVFSYVAGSGQTNIQMTMTYKTAYEGV